MSEIPVVIRNKINSWKLLSYGLNDWYNELGDQSLRFRKGYKTYKQGPYWEQCCEEVNVSLDKFFEVSTTENENDYWLYFDYKYMKDILPENSKLLQEVKWKHLGLDLSGKDSTIWIGNKGAHTPCHMDTYGCNLVAQILGRKLWILIPPEETESLCPVRVPYEESSVYSSHNFYTPNLNLLRIKRAYKVILNPGELLFIPKHWWHYVENLDLAISVNVWIPHESDHESRLEEALVRQYVSSLCQSLTREDATQLLNPNERELLTSPFEQESIQLFLDNLKKHKVEGSQESSQYDKLNELVKKLGVPVPEFSSDEIRMYIYSKSELHNYNLQHVSSLKTEDSDSKLSICKALINSYCHPDIVTSIRKMLTADKGHL